MFRLVQKGLRLSHCTPSSAGCQCAPVVRTVASGSLMDAFRQRKPIEGRVTTRSYTVGADKLDKPQSNIQLAVGSSKKRNAVEISDAAPQKPSQKHGRKAPARKSTAGDAPPENAAVDNPQPKAITSPIRKPAAAKRQSRRTAKPAMQPSADVAERRTTGDVEIAVSSSEASTATASASIQAAPSGLPAAIPSGLPADPAVLHCWTKESMAEAATYLADKDPGQQYRVCGPM